MTTNSYSGPHYGIFDKNTKELVSPKFPSYYLAEKHAKKNGVDYDHYYIEEIDDGTIAMVRSVVSPSSEQTETEGGEKSPPKKLSPEELEAIGYSRDFSLKTYGKSFYNCDVTKLLNHIFILEKESEKKSKALSLAQSMIYGGEKMSRHAESIFQEALSPTISE